MALFASGFAVRLCKYCGHRSLNDELLASTRSSGSSLQFSYLPDYPTIPLDKCEVISEAALQQHADTIVSCRICGCDECHVFSNSPVSQMHQLRQDEDSSYNRRLDFSNFPAEVFDKDLLSLTTQRNGLLIDQLERLVNLVKRLFCYERSCIRPLL